MSASKACSKCREVKPLEEYARDKRAKDGRRSACRACAALSDAAYHATPESLAKHREHSRRRVASGANAAAHRRARAANPEIRRSADRRQRAANAARTLEEVAAAQARLRPDGVKRCRRCRESLPLGAFGVNKTTPDGLNDSCRPCAAAAVAARKCAPYAPSWEARGLYGCYLCGAPYEHADHKHPKALDGADDPENLAPACSACNLSKHDAELFDWRPDLAALVASWPVEVGLLAA